MPLKKLEKIVCQRYKFFESIPQPEHPPTGTSPNWHCLQLALFANLFVPLRIWVPPLPVHHYWPTIKFNSFIPELSKTRTNFLCTAHLWVNSLKYFSRFLTGFVHSLPHSFPSWCIPELCPISWAIINANSGFITKCFKIFLPCKITIFKNPGQSQAQYLD